VINNANCGWVVKPEDKDDLVSIMRDVFSRPKQELHSFGVNGYNYAMKTFSRERNLNKLISIIEQANETQF
jgi:hypothetical protein